MFYRVVFCTLAFASAAAVLAADEKAKPSNERDDPIGRRLSERIGPFVQRLPIFLTTDGKYGAWKKAYDRLTVDEKIRYCIFQLRNESWSDVDEPYSDKPYSTEPEATASRELIKLGRAAPAAAYSELGFPHQHEYISEQARARAVSCAGCRVRRHREHSLPAFRNGHFLSDAGRDERERTSEGSQKHRFLVAAKQGPG